MWLKEWYHQSEKSGHG